ncbi:hypothetical protein A33Q_3817 [Indibacter alkaliphilus LW1]|uniref:Uncharacterized protein n=1 Tax=Indibacter alkaliphilus (strain CCUG 57479 / KCTC 22604 / LW1) TaxID=1189612 RepID=S2D1K1_INDAL|nr:hypothetical protein A33Q_3817 [Indibacter alkaliphilus LW1]
MVFFGFLLKNLHCQKQLLNFSPITTPNNQPILAVFYQNKIVPPLNKFPAYFHKTLIS